MTDRVALVTGGTRGLGAALSAALVDRGTRVFAAYRSDAEAANALAQRCGPGVEIVQVDVTDPVACRSLVTHVTATAGRLDYLVNNAGAVRESKVADIDDRAWERSIALNLSAAFHLTQAALGPMRAQRFGRVVNVSSVSATMGTPYQVDYAAAKSGLIGLTRSLARAVTRQSITVNCLLLGGFATELLDDLTLTDATMIESSVPVGRFGRPEEFVHAALALLDEHASYITGATLAVDGGLGMGH